MKVATLSTSNISKKQFTYIAIGIVAVLTIVGIVLGFLTFQRTSQASEDNPSNVNIQIAGTEAKVSWDTAKETIAVVEYGTSPDAATFDKYAFSENPTQNHNVAIPGLKPDTTYYFQIHIGETIYDNSGQFWTFKTTADTTVNTTPTTEPSGEPSTITPTTPVSSPTQPEASASPSVVPTPTKSSSPSGQLSPTSTLSATLRPTNNVTPSLSTTSTLSPSTSNQCSFTDCRTIQQNLGSKCTTQDYIKCLFNISTAPTASPTPTATPIPAAIKSKCSVDYLQSNSCKSFNWTDVTVKDPSCKSVYTKYFVQCKSSSFTSSDTGTWYCNETASSNTLTVPCASAPTPAPGQSVFCRVRAETTDGGDTGATDWVYASTSCPRLSSSNTTCGLSYLQANTCRSWLWDSVNTLNPVCKPAFDHYFFQCTDNGDFSGATGRWYCNTTAENHYLDLPCYNAPTPADGDPIQCRVRAEDAYGTDSHATDWVTTSATCPTSTPTPTFTPTPTNTPTPTPTP